MGMTQYILADNINKYCSNMKSKKYIHKSLREIKQNRIPYISNSKFKRWIRILDLNTWPEILRRFFLFTKHRSNLSKSKILKLMKQNCTYMNDSYFQFNILQLLREEVQKTELFQLEINKRLIAETNQVNKSNT